MRLAFRALTTKRLQLLPIDYKDQIERYATRFVTDIRDIVQTYPPPRANSRYVRTGYLGRSWVGPNITHPSGGLSVSLYNTAIYAKWVQGLQQVWYHKETGWKILQDYRYTDSFVRGLRDIYSHFRVA